jgi:hypothetical protein
MDDLESLSASVTDFATSHDLAVIPAIPAGESAPAVLLEPRDMELPAFLELARQLGDRALYARTETAGTDPETGEPDDLPAALARRKGQACDIAVAFASAHGILHVWSCTASWWQEWLDSQDAEFAADTDEDIRARQEERDRAERAIADAILADAEFRAAGDRGRRRIGRLLIPDGTDRIIGDVAAETARQEAADLTEEAYRPFWEHPEVFAAEFLDSPEWRRSLSARARKEVAAVEFLTRRVDGWRPTALHCAELYTQATKLPRPGDEDDAGLF